MEVHEIPDKVMEIISKEIRCAFEEVKPHKSLIDDLGADELGLVEIQMAIEEEFGIEIPDGDAEKFSTVEEVIQFVQKNYSPK
jgi:acyl carrier protein